jgi:hypothetical protein
MLETLVVFLIVLGSMAVLGWVFTRRASGKGGCGCGCGEDSCSSRDAGPPEQGPDETA